jgi:delta-aminolevulinic acid dehydratase/porphobilinogen synthase
MRRMRRDDFRAAQCAERADTNDLIYPVFILESAAA